MAGNQCSSVAYYIPERNYYASYTEEEWQNKIADFVKADANGMGLALIKTGLFNIISYPYFNFVEYENRNVLSEDLFLFDKMKIIGLDHYVVRGLKAGHIKKLTI
jgi:hypothetical protein